MDWTPRVGSAQIKMAHEVDDGGRFWNLLESPGIISERQKSRISRFFEIFKILQDSAFYEIQDFQENQEFQDLSL